MSLDTFNSIREAEERAGTDKIMKEAQERAKREKETKEIETLFSTELVDEVFNKLIEDEEFNTLDEVNIAMVLGALTDLGYKIIK